MAVYRDDIEVFMHDEEVIYINYKHMKKKLQPCRKIIIYDIKEYSYKRTSLSIEQKKFLKNKMPEYFL